MTKTKPRREFSVEFKRSILAEIDRGEATMTEIAAKHDLRVNMICRWRRQLRDQELDQAVAEAPKSTVAKEGVDPRYVRELEAKLREANEKLGEMYIVVEGLKKLQLVPGSTKNASSFVVTGTSWARSKRPAR
jgi:transposase-like protein